MKRAIAWLTTWRHLSLIAIIPITAHAHWHLAVQLGYPHWLAPLLPVALDAYVLASFRAWEEQANRGSDRVKVHDLFWALGLDMVAVAGSHAAGQYKLTDATLTPVRASLAALLGVILVLTLWRVHALDVKPTPQVRARVKGATRGPSVAPALLGADPRTPPGPEPFVAPASEPPAAPVPVQAGSGGIESSEGQEAATGSTLVAVDGPVSLDRWVALQVSAGASRSEAMTFGAHKFGVSQTTVKRRWLAAKSDAKVQAASTDSDRSERAQ